MKKIISFILFSSVIFCGLASAQPMLADKHLAGTQNCVMCHETTPTAGCVVPTSKCTSCHGSLQEISNKNRAKPNAQNPDPHINHSIGLNCNECHQGHQPAQNTCARCHVFEYQVP